MTKTFTVRIFPEDETTEMVYPEVTHAFWEAGHSVFVLCLPGGKHAHWLREWMRHYDVTENELPKQTGAGRPYQTYDQAHP